MKKLALIFVIFTLAACASKPKLYPNAKFESVGQEAAQKDIDHCIAKADKYLEGQKGKQMAKGAGAGAVMGAVIGGVFGGVRGIGRGAVGGAAVGTAGAALSPEQMKQRYVNKCLAEQGYEVLGWD
jgi:hypothetical protein